MISGLNNRSQEEPSSVVWAALPGQPGHRCLRARPRGSGGVWVPVSLPVCRTRSVTAAVREERDRRPGTAAWVPVPPGAGWATLGMRRPQRPRLYPREDLPRQSAQFHPTHASLLFNKPWEAQTSHTCLTHIVLCLNIELVLNKTRIEISKAGKGRGQGAL